MKKYLTDNEIAIKDYDKACLIQEILLEEGYVVMMSREERLWIINWIWCPDGYADRNDVIFISREDYEWEQWQESQKEEEEGEE